MKEVSSTTWTVQIIILFILIFACFLTLVLSYSKAYAIKNNILSVVEKYEGFTPESADIINSYMYNQSYKTTFKCPSGWVGAEKIYTGRPTYTYNDRDTNYYCFKKETIKDQIYYDVMVFYKFNLPVLGELATFRINGQTKTFWGSSNLIGG